MKRRDFLKSAVAGAAVGGLAAEPSLAAPAGVSDAELGAAFRIAYRIIYTHLEWDRGLPVVVLSNLYHREKVIPAMPVGTLESRILGGLDGVIEGGRSTLPVWYPPNATWPASDAETGAALRTSIDATNRGFVCKLALRAPGMKLYVHISPHNWGYGWAHTTVDALPVETLAARIAQVKAQMQAEAGDEPA